MKTSKDLRWAAPVVLIVALLPLLQTMYWQFYWFNYRLMHKIGSVLNSLT